MTAPTITTLEADLIAARAEVTAAETDELEADRRVSASREDLSLNVIVRKVFLVVQQSLADAVERTEQSKARVPGLDRLIVQARAGVAMIEARDRAERTAILAVQSKALDDRIGSAIVDIRKTFAAIAAEVAAFNAESSGLRLATYRSPTSLGAYERLSDGLDVLGRYWGPPKGPPPAPTRVATSPTQAQLDHEMENPRHD